MSAFRIETLGNPPVSVDTAEDVLHKLGNRDAYSVLGSGETIALIMTREVLHTVLHTMSSRQRYKIGNYAVSKRKNE
jgi:hypothetical protein